MKIGIVGFAGSGKTTLFNALTGRNEPTGYGGGKVNLGAIKVPDPRVDRLAELDDPEKVTYAEITFADVPGGRGASNLDSQTLGRIREMDALVQVIRGFDNGSEPVSPEQEFTSFEAELFLSDMQVAEKRVERLEKDRSDARQLGILKRCLDCLGEEKPLRELDLTEEDKHAIAGFAFLTLKPLLLVLSVPEDEATAFLPPGLVERAEERDVRVLPLSGPIEAEIAALDPEDQREFLADLGLSEPAAARFIKAAFQMLNLITFLTHGPDECRAWPIKQGTTAALAAGTIHSDIARGFIRAEVIAFNDLSELGSPAACKNEGKLRIEGKDYLIQDGDVCHFLFNV